MVKFNHTIVKVADISHREIPLPVVNWLKENAPPMFKDQQFNEHIYCMESAVEVLDAPETQIPDEVDDFVRDLREWANRKQYSYIRISYHEKD